MASHLAARVTAEAPGASSIRVTLEAASSTSSALERTWSGFSAWFICSAALIALAINLPGLASIAVVAMALIALSISAAQAYDHWRLRTGDVGLTTWLGQPVEWMPPSDVLKAPAAPRAPALSSSTRSTTPRLTHR